MDEPFLRRVLLIVACVALLCVACLAVTQMLWPVGRYEYRTSTSSVSVFDTSTGRSYFLYEGKGGVVDVPLLAKHPAATQKTQPTRTSEWSEPLLYSVLVTVFLMGVFVRLIYAGLRWCVSKAFRKV